MSKHTEGPWECERYAKPRHHKKVIMAPGLNPIALIHDGNVNAIADAYLIAAAPELLAACKEFVKKVEAGEARSTHSYQQMKSAIAKAEG